ncbi:MAG TPA: hypothetical protein VN428_13300 [Bryobacteraceae bacterium]|nr:hypothetical protein [Bryobacteraceae bacterium]
MAIIRDADRKALTTLFSGKLTGPVKLVVYSQRKSPLALPAGPACEWCEQTEGLVKELAELSERLSVEVYDFVEQAGDARRHGVDKIPAIAVLGAEDYGIRFFGIPAGYTFGTLVETIVDVSRGATDLPAAIKSELGKLDKDVHIQVLTTPT